MYFLMEIVFQYNLKMFSLLKLGVLISYSNGLSKGTQLLCQNITFTWVSWHTSTIDRAIEKAESNATDSFAKALEEATDDSE